MGEWESFGHEEGAEEEYPKFPGCVHSSVQQKECPAVGRDHVFMEKCCNSSSLSIPGWRGGVSVGKEQGRDAQAPRGWWRI